MPWFFRFPTIQTCALCHDAAAAGALCQACLDDLLDLGAQGEHLCPKCMAYSANAQVCPDCEAEPPPLQAVWGSLRYQAPVPAMLHRWKHQGHSALLEAFWQAMRHAPPPWLENSEIDAVLGMPVSRERRLQRGFNQSEELAARIADEYGFALLPRDTVLRRHRPPQSTLGREERARNIRQVFRLNHHIRGQNILLVDDVMTTGSSLYALAHTLIRGGAQVYAWVLAKNHD